MTHDKAMLEEYFTSVAAHAFKMYASNSMNEPDGIRPYEHRKRMLRFSMTIYQNLPALIDSCYEPKD